VMKSATWQLGKTTPNQVAALWARKHLDDPRCVGTHGYETLETWLVHSQREDALPYLTQLVRDDLRESLRHHAIHALIQFDARAELESLLPLLEKPPDVTWALHIALLDACRKFALKPPDLTLLRDADNVYVQRALYA